VKRSSSHSGLIVAAALAFLARSLPRSTEYLDPGTGSYVFQVVVGTMLGVAVAVKMGWRRMWGAVTGRSRKHGAVDADGDPVASQSDHAAKDD
jgi:hypothetical protein